MKAKYDEASMVEVTHGAITYLEEESLTAESTIGTFVYI